MSADYDMWIEARDLDNRGELVGGVQAAFTDGPTIITSAEGQVTSIGTAHLNYEATHTNWRHVTSRKQWVYQGDSPSLLLTLYMESGTSVSGEITNSETGSPVPDAVVGIFYQNGPIIPLESDVAGKFRSLFPLRNQKYLLDIKAAGFEPYRKLLSPQDADVNPEDPRTKIFDLTGENAVRLTPLKRPLIAADTLTMNRRGAFLPGAKKAGNQSVFNAFTADGPLTMTWGIDVGLGRKNYTVTLPDFEGEQSFVFEDAVKEVWLVDMKSFPNNPYDDEPVLLALPEDSEPGHVRRLIENIRNQADGFKNVYWQRSTKFDPRGLDPEILSVFGQVKLWQLPPDLFRPAFIVFSEMGAVNVYQLEYTGGWEGKELTGARLPPWFAGMADIMGSIAGSQAMIGEGLANALPAGKIIALPAFTAKVVLRATNALDYIYSIDTQIKEGMQSKIGGIMGFAPGFMGLSLYGGAEATLKGEDREFYLQLKGGVSKKSVNRKDFAANIMRRVGTRIDLIPPPAGEFYHIKSYLFDPDNRPDELAVLYGLSGQTGVEFSKSIVPWLGKIPKFGQILYTLWIAGAVDVRAMVTGLVGVRALTGFRTVYPRDEEHYTTNQGQETRQWRRHFLGGNEAGEDPVAADDPEKVRSLDIAFGFGMGIDAMAAYGKVGAKGTVELSGDDAWTGAPAMLIDINTNGDDPLFRRIRGDLRAVLKTYQKVWVAQFQQRWDWKMWPIDYQFGTESAMYLIEMEIVTHRKDLGDIEPAEFLGEDPLIMDGFSPLGLYASAGGRNTMLLYTDMDSSGIVVLKASLRGDDGRWESPLEVARLSGVPADMVITVLPDGRRLAAWTEINLEDAEGAYPPSKIMYSVGSVAGDEWSTPALIIDCDVVARGGKLISHGNDVALLFTEGREGPSGMNTGIYAVSWNGEAWSEPIILTESSLAAFDAVGSPDLEKAPSLAAFTDGRGNLSVIEWGITGVSDPIDLSDEAADIPALARQGDKVWLAYGRIDGGMAFFTRYDDPGDWVNLSTIFQDAVPGEIVLETFHEEGRKLVVAAWTQRDGAGVNLYYGAFDQTDENVSTSAPVTAIQTGGFQSPALSVESGGIILTGVMELEDGTTQIHGYQLENLIEILYGDINLDGVVDLQDLIIILRILVQEGPDELPGKSRADITRTGRIDPADALFVIQQLVRKAE